MCGVMQPRRKKEKEEGKRGDFLHRPMSATYSNLYRTGPAWGKISQTELFTTNRVNIRGGGEGGRKRVPDVFLMPSSATAKGEETKL